MNDAVAMLSGWHRRAGKTGLRPTLPTPALYLQKTKKRFEKGKKLTFVLKSVTYVPEHL